jgi:hypothetical protein
MKVIRRVPLAALAIVVATPLILLAELWISAGAAISQAQRTGLLAASSETAPLSTVERTIAIAEFGGAWDVRSTPCRSVDTLWRILTSGGRLIRTHATVSAALSDRIHSEQGREEGHLRRHSKQVVVACRLDQRYSDTEMLRAWLSNAYFGQRPHGVEHAAQALFGKRAEDLNPEESARLAALLKGPSITSAIQNDGPSGRASCASAWSPTRGRWPFISFAAAALRNVRCRRS